MNKNKTIFVKKKVVQNYTTDKAPTRRCVVDKREPKSLAQWEIKMEMLYRKLKMFLSLKSKAGRDKILARNRLEEQEDGEK